MTKLDIKDFRTLQKGLNALKQKSKSRKKESKKVLADVKDAENALMIIGTY